MNLETHAVSMFDAAESMFDFSRPTPAQTANEARLIADRADPEAGWATRNPERAMLFLFVTPREGLVADELLAL